MSQTNDNKIKEENIDKKYNKNNESSKEKKDNEENNTINETNINKVNNIIIKDENENNKNNKNAIDINDKNENNIDRINNNFNNNNKIENNIITLNDNTNENKQNENIIKPNSNNINNNIKNENNINIINSIIKNDNQNECEDSSTELMNFMYSEQKSKDNKRRNFSQEPKRNKDININISIINNKKKDKKKNSFKNLENDKDYKQLKEDIDKGTNFIDYFLIIGIEPKDFFDDKIYECDLEELKTKYKDKLKPKIISYFPKFEKKTIAFDDSIISHCFPNGFNLVKSNKMPKIEIFSFILDNNYFNLNYPQKYLSCLICYESINKYKILYEEYKKLSNHNKDENQKPIEKRNKSHKKDKNNFKIVKSLTCLETHSLEYLNISSDTNNTPLSGNLNEKIYIPKCIMIMSLYPFFAEYEKMLLKIYSYVMKIAKEPNELPQKEFGRSTEFIPRAMTISINSNKLSSLKTSKNIKIPLDKIIENLLIEFPVPPRGVFKVQYSLINPEKIEFQQSLMNRLPLIEVNLKKIFITFDIKEIIEIYLCLFLETRILFFSKDIEVLNIFIYGFLSLLFPFQYQYQIVTILPKENFAIIESITPFIAGINQSYEKDFFQKRDMILSDTILVVDIDEEKIDYVNKESEIPEFPKNFRKNLEKNLFTCVNYYMKEEILQKLKKKKKNSDKTSDKNSDKTSDKNSEKNKINISTTPILSNEIITNDTSTESKNTQSELSLSISEEKIDSIMYGIEEEDDIIENENSITYNKLSNFNINFSFNKKINYIFFNFNATLLSNYSKYLNLDFYSLNEAPCLEILFKVDKFLNDVPNSDKNFYNKFLTETQIFGDFIYMRMIPKNSKEKIRILIFDEQINKNFPNMYNKSQQNIFLDSREYEFCNKYSVQKARSLTKEEKSFYKDLENQKILLSYGIMIEKDKLKKGNIFFKYPIFPKLTTEFFFADNFKEYFIPSNLYENIETINEDIISKSHLGGIKTKQDDMINYIYLSWMQMWAMTFWYCDEQEKRYWFQELVKIIEKTSSHEMEIYNLLFETLSIYGKDYMILKLYDILLKLHLNPSFKVHNIAMKILDKKKSKMEKMNNQLQRNYQKDIIIKYKNKNFRKRTFKSKYYGNILSDNIIIYAFDTCINCQENINLEEISLNYKEMNRELMWTKCPSCKEYILPKITIQYGTEINKSGKLKINTSKNDCIVLFSPYFLKVNYNNSLLRNFGIKLDVEELMLRYNAIFWNSVWYFKLNNLEFDFMLPYQQYLDKMIFDKKLSISTFELEKDILNNKITYEDEEEESLRYASEELKIEKFEIILNKIDSKVK